MTPPHVNGPADVVVINPDGAADTLVAGYSFGDPQVLPKHPLRRAFAPNRFAEPVLLTHAGDGSNRVFVVELFGQIKVMPNRDDVVATTFLDITDRVTHNVRAQAGLLTLAFHPQHETNGLLYVYYSSGRSTSRLSEFHVSDDPDVVDPDSERIVLEVIQTGFHHNGNHLAFGPDGMLYASQGTGGTDEDQANGQIATNLMGTIYRIDVDARSPGLEYGIPPDNPFVGNSDGWREEIWVYGMRNPWRFSFDHQTGQLWEGDVGWGIWEEINMIEKGGNYGWVTMQGAQCNSTTDRDSAIPDCDRDGLVVPLFQYGHSDGDAASVTGGIVYRGQRLGGLRGAYIYGDFVDGRIWGLRYENGQVQSNDVIANVEAPASFGEDEGGEVYICAFERGWIYTFEPPPNEPTAVLTETPYVPQAHTLHQNHPNPFNPETLIQFELGVRGRVMLAVFNMAGQKVATLVESEMEAGAHAAIWDGRDDDGNTRASGVYLYRLEVGSFVQTKKLVLIR